VYTITDITRDSDNSITAAVVTPNWNANGYRLPTEAQWEYACRAGTNPAYTWHFGNDENQLVNYAWYVVNSDDMTHQVGLKLPNPRGLYDMYGNVWEWCWDWYGTLPTSNQTNYTGLGSGTYRVLRGGCWGGTAGDVRSARRGDINPNVRYDSIGFRLVRPE
jgi:formylglycine-generating enzyme required for sulfatase activity